ncbi:MAG: DUF3883 domain-containing protein [Pseudanabaena sp. CAN_BIN31]|nr:DUF3883 domain-containing protein [Pseudanabaena sp. CAN_BIN31]
MNDYVTPNEHRLDLHFPRSRFNTELEDTLMLLASKMVQLGTTPEVKFKKEINAYLKQLNGNKLANKTIDNHRTEMTSLFGLVKTKNNEVIIGNRTLLLVQTQDIPRFFKSVCNKFQYPNGINKIQFIEQYVASGIYFKPAQYLINLLRVGNQRSNGKSFAVTAKEIAHLVFNDKQVTVGQEPPEIRINLFLELRNQSILCDGTGDVIRYARDFLNFMVAANLLVEFDKRYFLNSHEKEALDFISNDSTFFHEFDIAKQGNVVERVEIKDACTNWEDYYADADFLEEKALKTTLSSFSRTIVEITSENNEIQTVTTGYEIPEDVLELIGEDIGAKQTTKQIGDEGEAYVYSMEKRRVIAERPDLIGLVKIVANDTSLGFDIQSVFDNGLKKYIEVKTTKRNFIPEFNATSFFTMSSNAWDTAKQFGDNYYIARVIIAKERISVFEIKNPFQKYEEGKIRLQPLEYRLTYTEDSGMLIVKDQINI